MVKTTRIIAEDENNYDKINNVQVEIIRADIDSGIESSLPEGKLSCETEAFILKKQDEFIQKTGSKKIQGFKPFRFEDIHIEKGITNNKKTRKNEGEKPVFKKPVKDSIKEDRDQNQYQTSELGLGYWKRYEKELLEMIKYLKEVLKMMLKYYKKLLNILGVRNSLLVKLDFFLFLSIEIILAINSIYMFLEYQVFTIKLVFLDLYLLFCSGVFTSLILENIEFIFINLLGRDSKKQKFTLFNILYRANIVLAGVLLLYYNRLTGLTFSAVSLEALAIVAEVSLCYSLLYSTLEYILIKFLEFLLSRFKKP